MTILPMTQKEFHNIHINAKQMRIYKITLNDNLDLQYQYFDPTLEICPDPAAYFVSMIPRLMYRIKHSWFQSAICRRNLETFSSAHQEAVSATDPDMNLGELIVKVPPEAMHLITEGRPLRIGIEFSLEQPCGGLHFSVPPGEGTLAEVMGIYIDVCV